jgi:manganese oxidase
LEITIKKFLNPPAIVMLVIVSSFGLLGVSIFSPAKAGQIRTYYIGVIKTDWNYAPSGKNLITGKALTQSKEALTFTKARYLEYTDETFSTTRSSVDAEYAARIKHMGIMGPPIYVEVGDTIRVVLKNLTPKDDHFDLTLHVHGLKYGKLDEGAPTADGMTHDSMDDHVKPGEQYVYEFAADDQSAPGPGDPDSIVFMYHSHENEVKDIFTGLIGPIVVTRAGAANPDGTPKNVDHEFFSLFQIFDEDQSRYKTLNDKRHNANIDNQLQYAINGYVFGNLPGLTARVGDRIRWYLLDAGSSIDLHTAHWHGNTVLASGGVRTDVIELLPGSEKTADMIARAPGTWMYHCHVTDHITNGMSELFTVKP